MSEAAAEYDGILLGAGHNALVLQAYLGRAGLKTLCLERGSRPGGGLATLEDPRFPGFLHNTHSFFHRAITEMPWYRDLELARHGARYLEPELNVALVQRNGNVLEWWTDFEKTAASFERLSAKDARTLRRWRDDFVPVLERIVGPEARTPPLPAGERRALLERSREGRLLLETSALSPQEFVLREFEHPTIQAGLLFFNGLREVDLRAKGFGHHIPILLASRAKAQMCVGGAAGLARALVAAVRESGGAVRCGVAPRRIVVERGRATGVETDQGEFVRARHFVASGLDPHQTFLELMAGRDVPSDWRDKAAKFVYNVIAPLFALNLSLRERPVYAAEQAFPELGRALMVILGLEGYAQYPEIVAHHERGEIPPTVMWGSTPTVFDPSQAPPGRHVAFMWEKLPYRLHGDPRNWDGARQAHGRQMLDLWTGYAPNLREAVIDWFTRSPLDTERALPNMRFGDLLVGAFTHGQIGHDRPFPGAGHYRGHVKGLYLCGSCCHPGGNITGLPGYNCAQVLHADLGLAAPWAPEPAAQALARL
ncbi:MAG: NAD(P)/FAD-dependent oxidoreductase [Burkholderiales bacterium]|nr:NAD(P)/FAD-dependent oxidoreductase [Burkholderiales bacterium]